MNQNSSESDYQVYRILPNLASPLGALFQKLDQSPNDPRAHFELGIAAQQLGASPLAVECFVRVTQLAPGVEAGFFNLGNALFESSQFEEARKAYEEALRLRLDPGTLINLGNTFSSIRNWEHAVASYDRALALADSPADEVCMAMRNKGKALIAAGDWDGALANYRSAISRFPGDREFLAMKANCHFRRFEFSDAAGDLAAALADSPQNPDLLCRIADINFCRGRSLESFLCMNHAFSMFQPSTAWQSRRLQVLSYCDQATAGRILEETVQWGQAMTGASRELDAEISFSSTPSLKVGVLCSSLARRGLGDWLLNCLASPELREIEWVVYCDQPVNVEAQEGLARSGCALIETGQLSDKGLASLIQSHGLSVLIEMIGHGHSTRLRAVAMKPAPIQVSWCGFPMTSGLEQVDFIWSDHVAIPPEHESFFSERVIRFSSSSFCFQPPHSIELTVAGPSERRPFRAGFLGRPEQVTEPWLKLARMILDRLPEAELVFLGQEYRDLRLQSEIRGRLGISEGILERIQFACSESAIEELDAYQQLDVSLDPLLVNSPQRAFESLWMGVPVITLEGDRYSGRCTASILATLNRREWVASDMDGYAGAVEQLARHRRTDIASRAILRSELLASPMCNKEAIAQNIHAAIAETIQIS